MVESQGPVAIAKLQAGRIQRARYRRRTTRRRVEIHQAGGAPEKSYKRRARPAGDSSVQRL